MVKGVDFSGDSGCSWGLISSYDEETTKETGRPDRAKPEHEKARGHRQKSPADNSDYRRHGLFGRSSGPPTGGIWPEGPARHGHFDPGMAYRSRRRHL